MSEGEGPEVRRSIAVAAVLFLVAGAAPAASDEHTFGDRETLPPSAPPGWLITAPAAAEAPTALAFDETGETLYVTSLLGHVYAYPVIGGRVAGPPTEFLSDLNMPLGIEWTEHGVFVSDVEAGEERDHGLVLRANDTTGDGVADEVETVISGLPNGRHNTNGLALGPGPGPGRGQPMDEEDAPRPPAWPPPGRPQEMLYIANGNSTDSGFGEEGGPPEVRPWSGSVLRVPPTATGLTPEDAEVVATGFRNIFDLAFYPGTSELFIPENGPDGQTYDGTERPEGEDSLQRTDVTDSTVTHHGFPWCLYDRDRGGLSGFTQDPAEGDCDDLPPEAFEGLREQDVEQAFPVALFGMHVSANGLGFDPDPGHRDLYVAEWGNLFETTSAGRKVVRVSFDADREVTGVEDFMNGIAPLGLTFAPDGAMWVADFGGPIYRLERVVDVE